VYETKIEEIYFSLHCTGSLVPLDILSIVLWCLLQQVSSPCGNAARSRTKRLVSELQERASGRGCQCHFCVQLTKTSISCTAKRRLLAALGHKRERTLGFFLPITTNERVGEMKITNWFDMNCVDQVTQLSRTNHFSEGLAVRGVAQHCRARGLNRSESCGEISVITDRDPFRR
jgi:hypothetical protein